MSRLVIKDLDFCQATLPAQDQVQGSFGFFTSTSSKGLWNWDITFDFDFDHDGISNFSVGHISAFAMAFGGFIQSLPLRR